jgi:hypothetical protein
MGRPSGSAELGFSCSLMPKSHGLAWAVSGLGGAAERIRTSTGLYPFEKIEERFSFFVWKQASNKISSLWA